MKNLKTLTNEELVAYYKEMQEIEQIEYSIDGSGECGHFIFAIFEPIWAEFEKEFDIRDIQLCHIISDCYESDMPY